MFGHLGFLYYSADYGVVHQLFTTWLLIDTALHWTWDPPGGLVHGLPCSVLSFVVALEHVLLSADYKPYDMPNILLENGY